MMQTSDYIKQQKYIYKLVIKYIENENDEDAENEFAEITNKLQDLFIKNGKDELVSFFHLISHIAKNHYRTSKFHRRIESFLLHFESDIKESMSNEEIFHLFRNNKCILLFLLKRKLIVFNNDIVEYFSHKNDNTAETEEWGWDYDPDKVTVVTLSGFECYFYPEIKSFLDKEKLQKVEEILTPEILENFEEKRENGLNESYISSLIRNDEIEKFVEYVNKNSIEATEKLIPTIFETNSFLLKKGSMTSLIEYAVFYGAIQIFQYLVENGAEITNSLWLYAVHSNNSEILGDIENQMKPSDLIYAECLKESIKCHHNNMANYFKNFLPQEEVEEDIYDGKNFHDFLYPYCFRYHNFYEIPADTKFYTKFFEYACVFNYITLVKLLVSNKEVEVVETYTFSEILFFD